MTDQQLQALLKQQQELSKRIEEARLKGRENGITQIKQIMADLGITAAMLGFYDVEHVPTPKVKHAPTFKQKRVFGPVEPKYRNPATGETWSGRGREPRWLEGKREDYVIKAEAEPSPKAA